MVSNSCSHKDFADGNAMLPVLLQCPDVSPISIGIHDPTAMQMFLPTLVAQNVQSMYQLVLAHHFAHRIIRSSP